ncbi:hypothetical protein OH77DRAFT_868598 [Trametes cingulata]|nr:hypothetical protein OH77DRAFT_868598 [Trametes cingulata]
MHPLALHYAIRIPCMRLAMADSPGLLTFITSATYIRTYVLEPLPPADRSLFIIRASRVRLGFMSLIGIELACARGATGARIRACYTWRVLYNGPVSMERHVSSQHRQEREPGREAWRAQEGARRSEYVAWCAVAAVVGVGEGRERSRGEEEKRQYKERSTCKERRED